MRFGRPNIPEILKDMARVAATKRPQASRPLQARTCWVLKTLGHYRLATSNAFSPAFLPLGHGHQPQVWYTSFFCPGLWP